jgi:hydrogenase nickel incorporation protein HypA/HybF
VHELSIACSLVETCEAAARQAGAARVEAVQLRIGALAGVDGDALRFGYDIAVAGTLLEGSTLRIEELPVAVYCAVCEQLTTLPSVQEFRCGICGRLTADIRQGRELEIVQLEVPDELADH